MKCLSLGRLVITVFQTTASLREPPRISLRGSLVFKPRLRKRHRRSRLGIRRRRHRGHPIHLRRTVVRSSSKGAAKALRSWQTRLFHLSTHSKKQGTDNDRTPGLSTSQFLANVSIGILEFAMGIRGAAEATNGAVRGSRLWRLNNNRYLRIGYGPWPRTQGRVPRISWGAEAVSKIHWDLRVCGR